MVTRPTAGDPGLPTAPSLWEAASFDEGDGYAFALPLVEGELHRAGSSDGTVDMAVRAYDQMFLTSVEVGFPVVGTVAPTDGVIGLAVVLDAPGESRWDGRGLSAGDVVLYPPGAVNTSVENPGLRYGAILIDGEHVAQTIEELGRRPMTLERGPLRDDLASEVTRTFTRNAMEDDPKTVVATVARVLSAEPTIRQPTHRLLSSEAIVQRAIDYVHSTGEWAPSSVALCRATRVSERRLQLAFSEMYGMTPTGFFRLRALSMARRQLLSTEETKATITNIATDLGFNHLGRFAASYQSVFGEKPSETLANQRSPGWRILESSLVNRR